MKKVKRIKSNLVAKAMVEDHRCWAPRVVENKKRKNALKPKYKNYGNDSVVSFFFIKKIVLNDSALLNFYNVTFFNSSEKILLI